MNPDDTPPMETTNDSNSPPQIDEEYEPVLMGEASGSQGPVKRNSGSGLLAALGLIVPVILGGVTVFGVYFLFLEDLLKPQKPDPKPSVSSSGDSKNEDESMSPPQPTFVPPRQTLDTKTIPESVPEETSEPLNAINEIAEREEDAANALKLAEKMSEIKPSAAESWYRKVVEKFPNTKAAREARDWLKRPNAGP